MREKRWIPRLLIALIAFAGIGFVAAPSASAACIGGQDYVGVSPTGPIKVGESAYPSGSLHTIPEWYGYTSPPITAWYDNSPTGIINPQGNLCSTNDLGGLWNQGIPETLSTFTGGLLEIDNSLLGVSSFTGTWVSNTQTTVQNFINSGPYSNLYTVLAYLVLAVGVVTVLLLVLTQDQRDRSDLMRTMMSGGSVRSRRSAAIKEVGWIVLSVALFGAIIGGLPYSIQKVVTDVSNGFSTAIQAELNNFSAGISGNKNSSITSDICSHTSITQTALTTGVQADNAIKCNLYRIYQWTPWLVMQFGSTNPGDFKIDPTSSFITEGAEVQKAIEQTRAKFGDEAATLAPYVQMQILRGNNNEGWAGTPELTSEERYQAFKDFGLSIDESKVSQSWAQTWAGQGFAKSGRILNAGIAFLFVLFLVFPVVTMVLLGNALAGIGAAILPIAGIAFALLIGMRQTRKKGMSILKWWVYCLLIPPIVTISLSLSLSVALLVTGLIDFSGISLFMYLTISSAAFVGVLIYLLKLLRGSAKRVSGSLDGSADEPGMVNKAMPTVGAAVGHAIAPGIGGAIGGAIGAGVAGGGSEPRPEETGEQGEPTPELPSGTRVGSPNFAPAAALPRTPSFEDSTWEDDIVDAEIIEDNSYIGTSGGARALNTRSEGYGGEEPRVSPYTSTEVREIEASPVRAITSTNADGTDVAQFTANDAERVIQDATMNGVSAIVQTTNAGAIFMDEVTQDRAQALASKAEEAAAAFDEAARQVNTRGQSTEGVASVEFATPETNQAVEVDGETAQPQTSSRRLVRGERNMESGSPSATQDSASEIRAANAAMTETLRNVETVTQNLHEVEVDLESSARRVRQGNEKVTEE